MLVQQIISGLAVGSLYALAALGLVLIYKTSDVVNFAQGEMAMITTFVSFTLMAKNGFPYSVSFPIALSFAFLFGILVERIFLRPVQNASILSQIILTLGLYMVFRGTAGFIWGHDPRSFPAAIEGEPIKFSNWVISPHDLFVLAITLILMFVIFIFFKYTMTGLAMRSVAQNLSTAKLMGINVSSVFSLTWATSTLLGGVAGMLIAPITFLDPNMMGEVSIKAFAAAVLGGFTSLPGAVIGGLVLGVSENLFGGYVSAELKTTFVFLLIILILYIRPTGLLGVKRVKKV